MRGMHVAQHRRVRTEGRSALGMTHEDGTRGVCDPTGMRGAARIVCLAVALVVAPAAAFAPAVVSRQQLGSARALVRLEVSDTTSDLFTPYSDMELAEQDAKLQALSDKWKNFEELSDYEDSKRSGFGPSPEIINGRTAMFFIVTGLITEYYTGQSMPQQVYTMLQTLSIIE